MAIGNIRPTLQQIYMDMAVALSKRSSCNRRKVGALIVSPTLGIISEGYNGTPRGMCNCCEDENGVTTPLVIHAEMNAIYKAAKGNNSSDGCVLYVTLSPCFQCALGIIQSGIKTVFYREEYRDLSGITFLLNNNVNVHRL